MYDRDAYLLLCRTSIRRLFGLRNGPHGADARLHARGWIRTLRQLEGAQA